MHGCGTFNLAPGQWTDDTSMALCLAESLIECQDFNPYDQMERYLKWFREGYLSSTGSCFDIGNTIRGALMRFESSGQPYSGSTDPYIAGNGSIMRLAPVPMFYARDAQMAIEKSSDSSRTTHGATAAVDACRYFGGLLVGALNGIPKGVLLSQLFSPVKGYLDAAPLTSEINEIASGSFKQRHPPQIRGPGYVVQALEAALWACYTTNTFLEGCLAAVNLGEDADTTGAVFGQLAGAYYGEREIPESWQSKLTFRDLIISYAERLFSSPSVDLMQT